MKVAFKYLLKVFILITVGILVIAFEVPDRIAYSKNNIAGYNENKYNISTNTFTKGVRVPINMRTYTKEPFEIININGAKLVMDGITYTGNSYKFHIISYATSTFEKATILMLNNMQDSQVIIDGTEYTFQYMGGGSREKNFEHFYFELYNVNDTDSPIPDDLLFTVDFPAIDIVTYERK